MNTLQNMINKYPAGKLSDQKNAMKEVIQELALYGLSRAGFFSEAAFYGGTALRIFYNLDRFSEDLDFSLDSVNPDFNLRGFFPILESEVNSFGINIRVEEKNKVHDSHIKSGFIKANTKELFLIFYPNDRTGLKIHHEETVKIKFEVDVAPPKFAGFERKYRLIPAPHEVRLYDLPSLFAGKLHAVLCRSWKSRTKGRDLYDYLFYLSNNVPVNLPHLRERMIESEDLLPNENFSMPKLKELLFNRFCKLSFEQAKKDVLPFIQSPSALEPWSSDFFIQMTEEFLHE